MPAPCSSPVLRRGLIGLLFIASQCAAATGVADRFAGGACANNPQQRTGPSRVQQRLAAARGADTKIRSAGRQVAQDTGGDRSAVRPNLRVGPIYEPVGPASGSRPADAGSIALPAGPQLFLDEYLIESSEHVTRRPITLRRDEAIPNPVITGKRQGTGDRNFQPWLSCLRDPRTGRFRIWYNIGIDAGSSGIGYLESEDGIHWERPHRQLKEPSNVNFCTAVIDEGPDFPRTAERYKMAFYSKDDRSQIVSSPDGLDWRFFSRGPRPTTDIINLARDPFRSRYICTHGVQALPQDGYEQRSRTGGIRRMVGQSVSSDLKTWSPPRRIIMPSAQDEGVTEYYGMGGLLPRGEILVGMLKVLRDDLPCDEGGPIEGIGYTVVAWSHDGENWLRERVPLVDRDHESESWDHAHAWVDVQLPVGDQVYLYYGGYKGGHKVNRFEERQVGLIRMRQDRYVAREAGPERGLIRTPPVLLRAAAMTVNIEPVAAGARVLLRVLGQDGEPLPGFTYRECTLTVADSVAVPVNWARSLSELKDQPVSLEFQLQNVRLYGFEIVD